MMPAKSAIGAVDSGRQACRGAEDVAVEVDDGGADLVLVSLGD